MDIFFTRCKKYSKSLNKRIFRTQFVMVLGRIFGCNKLFLLVHVEQSMRKIFWIFLLIAPMLTASAQQAEVVTYKTLAASIKQDPGKIQVINFWATWCGPCVAEFPNIEKLKKAFKGKQVEFYIVSEEPLSTIRSFAAKKKLDLPYYKLNTHLPPIFNGSSIPRTYIISKGKIILSHSGAANWNDGSIISLIEKELSPNK